MWLFIYTYFQSFFKIFEQEKSKLNPLLSLSYLQIVMLT